MFENFNGTPLLAVRMLTMHRAEMSSSGPLADLARKICGIAPETSAGEETAYSEQAAYARRQDTQAN